MRITIDRSQCPSSAADCERCLAQIVHDPQANRQPCFTQFENDGDPNLILTLRSAGREEVLLLPPEARAFLKGSGWLQLAKALLRFVHGVPGG